LMLAVRVEKAHVRISTETAKAKVKTKNKENKDEEIPAQFPLYVKPGDKITVPLKVSWQGEGARPNPVTVTLEPTQPNMATSPLSVAAPMPIAKDKNDGTITLDVRVTALPGTYPVVLRGETTVPFARDPNKKDAKTNVTVSGFAQPMEIIVLPLNLGKFTASISGSIKAGMNGELVVKVDRANDYEGEFKINITLPKDTKGIVVKDVVLPAGVNEVKIPIMVAADAKPGTLQNVIMNAVATVHGKFPIAHDAKFNLVVSAADKKK